MTEPVPSVAARLLKAAAYIVVVAWGIRTASHILYLILIALLFAYVFLPFPKWLMRRFHLSQSLAITLTIVAWATIHFTISLVSFHAVHQLMEKLPIYAERIRTLQGQVLVFLGAHGIQSTYDPVKNLYGQDRIVEFARAMLPRLIGFFSDRILIFLLGLGFLMEMTHVESGKAGPFAKKLVYYGGDVQRFIALSAEAGAINALLNLVLLSVLGVDGAFVWCFLYFFLQFIPNIGFVIAMLPPSLMALLMLGWKWALLVVGGLILTQMLGDYVVRPMLMKKGLNISFLEIMLSLVIWGFLLGTAGAILAIPLTLAVRRAIERPYTEPEAALAQEAG
jgi:AI-2 transport protein TqsA